MPQSTTALTIPLQLDRAHTALAQASTDFERLRIRDQAKAYQAAAKILGYREIQVQASVLVQDAERAVAKANPPESATERGRHGGSGKKAVMPDNGLSEIVSGRVLRQIRHAHDGLSEQGYQQVIADLGDEPLTREKVKRAKMAEASAKVKDEQAEREGIEPPTGLYDVIVIDPPWPVAQNQRPQRPNQHSRYAQMTLKQITEIAIPAETDCWVWLWTTNKYLPHAFATLKAWKATYRYALVWDKRPDGMQLPNTPRLTAEFVLLAAIGSPLFTTTKQFPTVLSERPAGDSRKPEAFYELVRSVTSGSRLDMFNRRSIEGFTGWGYES